MFFNKKNDFEEVEEIIENKINDIEFETLEKEVDVSSIFTLSKVWAINKLFKKNTKDILKWLNDIKTLYKEKKIKLIKIKNPLTDLKNTKKNQIININTYKPKADKDTINLLNIETFKREVWPYSDIYFPKYSLWTRLFIFFKKTFRNLKNLSKTKIITILWIFLFFIFSWVFYKNLLENRINNIVLNVKNININADVNTTKENIENLKFDIITLKFLSKPIFILNYVLQVNDIKNLQNVLDGGSYICDSVLDLIFVYNSLEINIKNKWFEEFYIWEFLKNSQNYLTNSFVNLNNWISYLENVNFWNDENIQKIYSEKLNELKDGRDIFSLFLDNFEVIKSILGDEEKRKYLVVFQNADEIRPTWGFMWSVLFFDVYKWKILNFEKKDIYALEWWIKPFKEIAPDWINEISETFWLRDANYFPNIETSSLKIKSFLDKSNYKVDGIVYINQNIILDFLDYFWWIYFDEIKKELNSSNFSMMTSTLVESKLYKEWTLWTPKQILFDFIMLFFEELKKKWDYSNYAKIILNWLNENEILVYSFHEKEQKFISEIWFKNDLLNTQKLDFNYPVFTSISWNKSDRYVNRTFEKKVNLNKDCTINTSFQITSKHTFDISKEIEIKNFLYDMWVLWNVDINSVLNIQWKALNRQFVRLYIPSEAIIDNSSNYTINVLDDRKEISFYIDTPLLSDSNFKISYTLPNVECKNYEYELVKQPWLRGYNLEYHENWNLVNSSYIKTDFIYQK